MKIFIIAGSVLATTFLVSFSSNKKQDDNREKLKAVIASYFDAIANKDTAKMLAVTTKDFLLYEDGLIWDNDSAFMNIRRNSPFRVKYKFDNFRIYADTKSGDMSYTAHADFVFRDSIKVALNFIENATFRKVDGVWKMNFLAATTRR